MNRFISTFSLLTILSLTVPATAQASWLSKGLKRLEKNTKNELEKAVDGLSKNVKSQVRKIDDAFDDLPDKLKDVPDMTEDIFKKVLKNELKKIEQRAISAVLNKVMPADVAQVSIDMLRCGFKGKSSSKCREEVLKEYVEHLRDEVIETAISTLLF